MITIRKASLADAKDLTNILVESWQAAFVGIMSDEMIKNCTVPENYFGVLTREKIVQRF